MPFNENFVVRNGLEVASNLIYADYITNKVGIGTTALIQTLSVNGDIGAQNITISGISTVSQLLTVGLAGTVLYASSSSGFVGVGTSSPQYKLDIRSPVSTGQTALYVQGDSVITGNLQATNITFNDANLTNLNVTGIASISSGILTSLSVSGSTSTKDLNVSGITTLGITSIVSNLRVSGVSTFVGISTFLDDVYIGKNLQVSLASTFRGPVNFNTSQVIIGQSPADDVTINSSIFSDLIPKVNNQNYLGSSSSKWGFLYVGFGTFTNIYSSGISTLGTVKISSGIITASSGIITYYGDGSNLTGIATNLTATIGVASESTFVGSGVTTINFKSTTGTAVDVVSSGTTATVTITPGVSLGLAIALGG